MGCDNLAGDAAIEFPESLGLEGVLSLRVDASRRSYHKFLATNASPGSKVRGDSPPQEHTWLESLISAREIGMLVSDSLPGNRLMVYSPRGPHIGSTMPLLD